MNSLNTKQTTIYDVENQVLAWDKHNSVAGLNQLMWSQPFHFR
jgi:hypothetical protein